MSDSSAQTYLFKVWFTPGTVVRALIDKQEGHTLATITALLFGLFNTMPYYFSSEDFSPAILGFGAFIGLFGLYLFSWLLRNFARWFGSKAKFFEVRIALGWALIPWLLLFGALTILLVKGVGAEQMKSLSAFLFLFFIYGYVVILQAVASALRLPVLKAFLCLVVTCIVSLFPIILLVQFVAQAFGVAPSGT